MNFKPEKVFLGKNPDGSKLRIEEWNYNSRAGLELAGSFINLFVYVIFVQIASPYLLALSILTFDGRKNILNIIGLLLGFYFLYDASHGWLVTNFLHILLNETILNLFVYLNALSVVLHGVLLFFGGFLFRIINKNCKTKTKCEETFTSILAIIGFIVLLYTSTILNNNKGWVKKNISEYIQRNKEPEPVQVEEIKPSYDDGFFHEDPDYKKRQDEFYHGKSK